MHYQILQKYNLPTSVSPDFCFDHYEICQRQDKTCIQGKVYMGLMTELGQLWDQNGQYSIPVDFGVLREAFQRNQEKFSEDMDFADWAWLRG